MSSGISQTGLWNLAKFSNAIHQTLVIKTCAQTQKLHIEGQDDVT